MRSKLIPSTLATCTVVAIVVAGGLLLGTELSAQSGSVAASDRFEFGDGVDPLAPDAADIAGSTLQPGPDWGDLFNADRTLKDQYDEFGAPGSNGVPDFLDTWGAYRSRRDTAFIADDVSAGGGVDATVFVAPGVVGSGTVAVGLDLGNAYAYTGFADLWNLNLYAGVERLSNADGTIVFEFNRKILSVGSAGEIVGQKSIDDLQVRVTLAGATSSVSALQWDIVDAQTGTHDWVLLETLSLDLLQQPGQCNTNGTICTVCNVVSVGSGAWTTYDDTGNPTQALLPETFLELGINLTALLGHNWRNFYNTRYATVQISSYDTTASPAAHDYALGTFARAARLVPNGSH